MIFDVIIANLVIGTAQEQIRTTNCEACDNPSEVVLIAVNGVFGMREVLVCKDHMLDPGPLLDW
jgi:hypothetical protein